jgi:hypothetical protein
VKLRRVIMFATPCLSLATLALGLRLGAQPGVHAAAISVEPAGAPGPLYAHLVTFWDESGVKEAKPLTGLVVIARSAGKSARWEGGTSPDGTAIVPLDLGGDLAPIEVEVRAPTERGPLLRGVVEWPAGARAEGRVARPAVVRPEKQTGDFVLTAFLPDERLTVEGHTNLFVEARDRAGRLVPCAIEVLPEPGMEARVVRSCGDGRAHVDAVALFHVTGLGIRARTPDGKTAEWFGAIPTAPGALRVDLPAVVAAGKPFPLEIHRTNARTAPYVELQSARGRVFAARVTDERPNTTVELPPLEPGPHWLIVAGEPKAATRIEGPTVAHPFLVAAAPLPEACVVGPTLGPPASFTVVRAELDGLPSRRQGDAKNRRTGLFLALASLVMGGVIEAILLGAAAGEARRELERAMRGEADEASVQKVATRTSAGNLVVGLLLVAMGFALFASFVLWRS